MKLNIEVTQENIDRATPMTKCKCPIALAVRAEALANHQAKDDASTRASIDQVEGRIHMRAGSFKFQLPKAATQFIADRDAKKKVSPFSFSVEAKNYTETVHA